jgi:Ni/Co efflux regulator RcnB
MTEKRIPSGMEFHRQLSAYTLMAALACAPAAVYGQQNNNQDNQHQNNGAQHEVRQAGKQTKDAARNGGNTTKKATSNAYHRTSRTTKNAWTKTSNTAKGTVQGGKQGAQQPH